MTSPLFAQNLLEHALLDSLVSGLGAVFDNAQSLVEAVPRGIWVFVAIIVGLYFCLGLIKGNP